MVLGIAVSDVDSLWCSQRGQQNLLGCQWTPIGDCLVEGIYWWFPREIVDAPSVTVFKTRLDQSWSKPLQWKVSLPTIRGLELGDL